MITPIKEAPRLTREQAVNILVRLNLGWARRDAVEYLDACEYWQRKAIFDVLDRRVDGRTDIPL
jgi:hypothetical protein